MSSASYAMAADGLYQSRATITHQGEAERQQATAIIMQDVVLKVVGNRTALSKVDLTPLLEQADQFIAQYAYERDPALPGSGQQLVLSFNAKKLNQAIAELGLPIWNKNRPDVLLWLVVDDNNKQKIYGSEDAELGLYHQIKQVANIRGLSIFLPLMDLQDQQKMRFAHMTSPMTEDSALVQASQRYGAGVILLARVIQDQQRVSVDWQWLGHKALQRYQSKGSMKSALTEGIEHLADTLAGEFSVVEKLNAKRDYQMIIEDVNSFSDYSSIQSYLNAMQAVSRVHIVSLKDKQLDLMIRLTTGIERFNQLINKDGVMMLKTQQRGSDVLVYQLRP